MNFNNLQHNFDKIRPLLTVIAIVWLLGALGLGWLVNSLLIIIGFLLITPVIAFVGINWWIKRNLVTDNCPVCEFEITGINNSQLQCPSCGEKLSVKNNKLSRFAPEGTIDVTAVEVQAKSLED